jgi:hypothetical protein
MKIYSSLALSDEDLDVTVAAVQAAAHELAVA